MWFVEIALSINTHFKEINPPVVKIQELFPESSKSGKETSAHAQVCLQDLQVSREIFLVLVFLTTGRIIKILHLQKCTFLPFFDAMKQPL